MALSQISQNIAVLAREVEKVLNMCGMSKELVWICIFAIPKTAAVVAGWLAPIRSF